MGRRVRMTVVGRDLWAIPTAIGNRPGMAHLLDHVDGHAAPPLPPACSPFLFFIHHGSRRVFLAGITTNLTRDRWPAT